LKKYIVKAKDNIEDQLKDFYIVGKGYVSDSIASRDDMNICSEINAKISQNELLKEKIEEYSNDERFIDDEIQVLSEFNNIRHWRDFLLNY